MALAESYTLKPNSVPSYFDALLDAQAPERFSLKFLENLGFTSTNDRLFVGILKDLGFLNRDGAPQARYFEFLDRSQSKRVVADGIRDAFADLFAINTKANTFTVEATHSVRWQEVKSRDIQHSENIQGTMRLCGFHKGSYNKEIREIRTRQPF